MYADPWPFNFRSMNGVLEMEGFQETYRYLYNGSNGSDGAGVCSTGNGAGSATIIVRIHGGEKSYTNNNSLLLCNLRCA